MRKIPHDVKQKVIALRKKYAEGYVSEEYMRTGIPKNWTEKAESVQDEIAHLLKESDKQTKKAIANQKRKLKRRRTKIEDNIFFI